MVVVIGPWYAPIIDETRCLVPNENGTESSRNAKEKRQWPVE